MEMGARLDGLPVLDYGLTAVYIPLGTNKHLFPAKKLEAYLCSSQVMAANVDIYRRVGLSPK